MFCKEKQKKVTINLHNYENAIEFIDITNSSFAEFDIQQNQVFVDGKSMLGVLSLDLSKKMILIIIGEFDVEKIKKWKV